MRRKKAFLLLQAAICIMLALLLAAGVLGMYAEGTARQAEDPLESIYTSERAAQMLRRLAPAIFLLIGLLITGILLGVRDPNADKPADASRPVKTGNDPKRKPLIQTILVAAAAAFILLGILNGSARDVLVKAINICTECIGLG